MVDFQCSSRSSPSRPTSGSSTTTPGTPRRSNISRRRSTGAGVFPLLVPSFGDRLDLDQLLDCGRRRHGDRLEVERASLALWRRRQRGQRSLRSGPRRHHSAADPQGDRARRAAARDLPRHPGAERGARRHAGHRDPGAARARSTTARRPATTRTNASPSARRCRSSRAAALPACSAPATSWSIRCTARRSTGSGRACRSRRSPRTAPSRRFR